MGYSDLDKQRKYAREWAAARRVAWFADKKCVKCGSIQNLQIDHKDPNTKDASLRANHTNSIWSWSRERREKELNKCQVLCKSCHKEKTSAERRAHLKHGMRGMYTKVKCRCTLCREANAKYMRGWRC